MSYFHTLTALSLTFGLLAAVGCTTSQTVTRRPLHQQLDRTADTATYAPNYTGRSLATQPTVTRQPVQGLPWYADWRDRQRTTISGTQPVISETTVTFSRQGLHQYGDHIRYHSDENSYTLKRTENRR